MIRIRIKIRKGKEGNPFYYNREEESSFCRGKIPASRGGLQVSLSLSLRCKDVRVLSSNRLFLYIVGVLVSWCLDSCACGVVRGAMHWKDSSGSSIISLYYQ